MSKQILGHIDCPTCGSKGGMRITTDKNGDPFGFCKDGCKQQLRIGGDPDRVHDFYAAHPSIAKTERELGPLDDAARLPVTETAPAQAKPAAQPAAPVTETAPAQTKPARKPAANPFDFLLKGTQA